MAITLNGSTGITSPGGDTSTSLSTGQLTVTGTGVLSVGTNQIYKDSSGNVGIGTSSPTQKLHVSGNFLATGSVQGGSGNISLEYATNIGYLWTYAGSALSIGVNGAEKMRLDSSGNLGLGVTPSGWGSGWTALQIKSGGASIWTDGTARSFWGNNEYYDGTNRKYVVNGGANEFLMNSDGSYAWKIAPSGTAGNTISFTQAMTLDASGNLGIGTSSPGAKLDVIGILQLKNAAGNIGGFKIAIDGATDNVALTNYYSAALTFGTSNTERARIDSSGNLGVGTTNPQGKIDASGGTTGFYRSSTSGSNFFSTFSSGTTGDCYYANVAGTGQNLMRFEYGGSTKGSITTNGTTITYGGTSDQRLKNNIIDAPSALDSVNAIKVRSFDWNSDGSHVDYGYIAQELLEVVPEAVHVPEDPEELLSVDFGKLTPRLVKAIQELTARLEALEGAK